MIKYSRKFFSEESIPSGSVINLKYGDKDFLEPDAGFGSKRETTSREISEEIKLNEIKRDSRNMKFGINLPNEISMIKVSDLIKRDESLSPYEKHTDEEKKTMKCSLERLGVLHPFIVTKEENGKYMIVDGENRCEYLNEMFKETGNIKYESVSCIVLLREKYSDLDLREISIDSNLNRKCSSFVTQRIILMMQGILRAKKVRLKDVNIAREIAGKLRISISSVYSYLALSDLTLNGQILLNRGQISLSAARKFVKFSHRLQDKIIEKVGMNEMSDFYIKGFIGRDFDESNLDKMLETIKSWRHPFKYKVTIGGYYNELEEIEKLVEDYLKQNYHLRKRLKVKTVGKYFDFVNGLNVFGEREMRIPKHFQKFIEGGEVGNFYGTKKSETKINKTKETVKVESVTIPKIVSNEEIKEEVKVENIFIPKINNEEIKQTIKEEIKQEVKQIEIKNKEVKETKKIEDFDYSDEIYDFEEDEGEEEENIREISVYDLNLPQDLLDMLTKDKDEK